MMKKTIQKVTGFLAFGMLLGVLALGQNAYAQSATQTMTPKQIVMAVKSGATVAFVDADGNVIWSSDESTAPTPALLAEAAKVVITTANGEVIEAPVATNPQGRPALMVDGHYLGLGALLQKAGYGDALQHAGYGRQAGANRQQNAGGNMQQNRKRHQYRNQQQNQQQNADNCAPHGRGNGAGTGKHGRHAGQNGGCNCQKPAPAGN